MGTFSLRRVNASLTRSPAAVAIAAAALLAACGPAAMRESTDRAVAEELVEMGREDQRVRNAEGLEDMSGDERRAFFEAAEAADRRHATRLREIVAVHGWPDVKRFGDEAARAAFLIVQHADHDPEFQAAQLPLLEEAAMAGRIDAAEYAYLFDRVRVAEGRTQRYGTQYEPETAADGSVLADASGRIRYLPPTVEDPAALDSLREDVGLGPWIEYERRMAAAQEREPFDAPRSAPATTTEGRSVSVAAVRYPYAVQLPTAAAPPAGWPVILALHGAGSRGDDGMRMRGQSIAEAARTLPDRYPAIVVMPQTTGRWTRQAQDAALAALAEVEATAATDRARTYIVGQSMGADGAVELAGRHPERFAALVLVAPGCCGARVEPEALSAIPVRILHGGRDRIPISYSRELVTRLREAGNDDVRLIEYPEAGHDIFDRAYAEPTLAAWLLESTKDEAR